MLESTSGTAKGSGVIRDVSDWADQPTYIGPPPVDPFEKTLELAQLEEAGPSEATRRLRRATTVDETIDDDVSDEGIVQLPPGTAVH